MTRGFDRATSWIVDYPFLSGGLVLVITAVATWGHYAPHQVRNLFRSEEVAAESQGDRDSDFDPSPDVNPFSIADAHAIVVVEAENFFTPAGAETMRNVVRELEALPYVRDLVWLDRVPTLNIFGLVEPLFPRATASQTRFDQAQEKALANPLVTGQFLSADGKTMLLLVNFDFFFVESDEDCVAGLREAATKAASATGRDFDVTFSVTGNTPLRLAFLAQHDASVLKYQLIGYGVIALMALILFRGLSAVFIVAVAPALGVFWTIGLLQFFDVRDNPFNDVILPVLISLVGLTDGVHLMVHIRKLRASGQSARDAARTGIHEVGLACALTSLTTAIGFGSLILASHEVVREFGMCCVLGVVCTFVSVVTTIPLLCASPLGRNVHRGLERSLIDKNLTKIGGIVDFTLQHVRFFSTAGIAVTVTLGLIACFLRPDERRVEGMPLNAEPVIALGKMDRELGGLEIAEIRVGWSKNIPSDSGKVLEVVTAVDDFLQQEPLIGHPLSIRNLLQALPGSGEPSDRMSLLELLPPPLKRAFYVPERRHAKINFRVQDIGIAKYGPVFERIQAKLHQLNLTYPEFELNLESRGAVWRWEHLHRIVVDLIKSLLSASVIIFIVLTIAYRSLRIGLISIIPNVFPLVLAASFLVVTGQYLEVVSVCSFTVCLGIAVDDTIHFLTRYEEERRRTPNHEEAIRRAFTGVGTALIMTTAVLLAGFCTVLISENREHRIFAGMGAITLGSALFADMIFLPAILARFAPNADQDDKGPNPPPEETTTETPPPPVAEFEANS